MRIKILGSAAGGGFPQINCNCRNCANVRAGKPGYRRRTQSSVAVSGNGADWVLLNASPDLREQIAATRELAPPPGAGPRGSPIKAVIVTNGDVDHIAGLLSLRESIAFTLCGSRRVLDTLAANRVFDVLDRNLVPRMPLDQGQAMALAHAGADLGLSVEAFTVPGKIALYMENPAAGRTLGTQEGDTIGLKIIDPLARTSFFYIPGCAQVDEALAARLRGAPLVLFDGTLYSDDEMVAQGVSGKTGTRMGHISMCGTDGSIAAFGPLEVQRRVFVHMNNTNPVLRENGPEHAAIRQAGWEVAYDGMEISL